MEMQKQIQKSLNECLSKIKISNKQIKQIQFPIRSCRRVKTSSFAVAESDEKKKEKESNDAVTLSDIDHFLFENFRSLYGEEDLSESEYDGGEKIPTRGYGAKAASFPYDTPLIFDNPPPEKLYRSSRFFVASGSSSSRIVDEVSSSSANDSSEYGEEPAAEAAAPDDFIALLTYSPKPYDDFRGSMQEMVDARVEHNGKVDWDFLEELLFCYLDLNNKKSYRYILKAFVDLIVALRENSGKYPPRENSGKCPPPIRPPMDGDAWRKQIK